MSGNTARGCCRHVFLVQYDWLSKFRNDHDSRVTTISCKLFNLVSTCANFNSVYAFEIERACSLKKTIKRGRTLMAV